MNLSMQLTSLIWPCLLHRVLSDAFCGKFPLKITHSSHEKLVVEKYKNHLLVTADEKDRKLVFQLKDIIYSFLAIF